MSDDPANRKPSPSPDPAPLRKPARALHVVTSHGARDAVAIRPSVRPRFENGKALTVVGAGESAAPRQLTPLKLPHTPTPALSAPAPAPLKRKHRTVRIVKHTSGPDHDISLLPKRYVVDRLIARGGMGSVYRSRDNLLDRDVAVKVLNHELTRDVEAIAQIKEEARITVHFSHPHIVRLYDLLQVGTSFMLVMEYIDGTTLRKVIKQQDCLAPDNVAEIIGICADALEYAQSRGILHNDLKLDNVLLTHDGVLKIIDFGTAHHAHQSHAGDYVLGTPVYMSPEQVRGETLDARSDIYALGMMAHELLTGSSVYSEHADLGDILAARHAPLELPDPLRGVVECAIAPAREERWNSALDFAAALTAAVAALERDPE